MIVFCCPNPIPNSIFATFTGAITGSGSLSYSNLSGVWEGAITLCGFLATVSLGCVFEIGTGWVFNLGISGGPNACSAPTTGASSVSCSPFSVTFNMTGDGGCCNGLSFTVTVTQ